MTSLNEIAGRCVLGLVFALIGAITGMIAAAVIGVLLLMPGMGLVPGIAQATGALLIAGAALGALFGLHVLHRL